MLTKDKKFVEEMKSDYTKASLDQKSMAIIDYAVKLTRKPSSVKEADVDKLREVGCNDNEILDICQVASYFNFVNRMAEGLGVQLETEYQ